MNAANAATMRSTFISLSVDVLSIVCSYLTFIDLAIMFFCGNSSLFTLMRRCGVQNLHLFVHFPKPWTFLINNFFLQLHHLSIHYKVPISVFMSNLNIPTTLRELLTSMQQIPPILLSFPPPYCVN
jgi:hypothetical protein